MRQLLSTNAAGIAAGTVAGNMVFTAASAIDVATMKRVSEADTIKDETRVILQRIERTLAEAGCTLRDLAKVTCFVSEEKHRLDFAAAWRDLLAPGPYPSRAMVRMDLVSDCRVQVDAIAVRPVGEGKD
ncbi:RidA family protein [Amycolatopsis sp. NPDC003676]